MGGTQECRAAWDGDRLLSAAARLGPRALDAAAELLGLLQRASGWDNARRLEAVNSHVNHRVSFAEDALVWQQADYWASPLETLARGEGDCEDYAITKYFVLVALGVPVARLRLVYVRARLPGGPIVPGRDQAHMVLAYQAGDGGEPLILDNLEVNILPASLRPDLTPVFSFNSEGLWESAQSGAAGDPLVRLSRWRETVRKARAEGFP